MQLRFHPDDENDKPGSEGDAGEDELAGVHCDDGRFVQFFRYIRRDRVVSDADSLLEVQQCLEFREDPAKIRRIAEDYYAKESVREAVC